MVFSSNTGANHETSGSVIVFREDVTEEQAAEALRQIEDLLDTPETTLVRVPAGERFVEELGVKKRCVKYEDRPFQIGDLVKSYDSDYGEPVWYIP